MPALLVHSLQRLLEGHALLREAVRSAVDNALASVGLKGVVALGELLARRLCAQV